MHFIVKCAIFLFRLIIYMIKVYVIFNNLLVYKIVVNFSYCLPFQINIYIMIIKLEKMCLCSFIMII